MDVDSAGKGVVPLRVAAVFACCLFASGYACLAGAPQNPDGAELVMAALQGAVLHPPGYPLQAWIGKAWSLASGGATSWGYSLLCLALQSLAAFVFLLASREYGLRPLSGLVAAGVLFFFPPVFMLGVQPEKYALVLLCASLLLMERFWFLSGLALSQHFGLAIFLPLVLWRYSRRHRPFKWFRFFSVCAAGFLVAQMSLLLLAKFGGWPDWGALRSLHDVVHHTLRSDLGFLGGTKDMGPLREQLSSLVLLFDQWGWLVLIWGAAILPACAKLRSEGTVAALAASAGLGIAALWLARLPGTSALDREYLARYWVIVMPLVALMIGMGVEHVSRWQKMLGIAALAATFAALGVQRQSVNLSGSRVFDVYREALSRSMGNSLGRALYVSNSDVEPFWGVRKEDGSLLFPVAGDFPWYLEQKVSGLDPRVIFWMGGRPPSSTAAIMQRAFELGIPVVSTTPDTLPLKVSWKNCGLYSESSPSGGTAPADELELAAGAVCGAMVAYGQETPGPMRYGSLDLWEKLREPFRLLESERLKEHNFEEAAQAKALYAAMEAGSGSSNLRACEAFLEGRGRYGRHD